MNTRQSRYKRHRFPPAIISYAVWLYHRFSLSFRDIEHLLAQRGVVVSYESIRRWCLKFGPQFQHINAIKEQSMPRPISAHCMHKP